MISWSISFRIEDDGQNGYFWLPIGLNSVIFGSDRDKVPKLLLGECNGRIYIGRAWFQGHISFFPRQWPKKPIWLSTGSLGSICEFWDLCENWNGCIRNWKFCIYGGRAWFVSLFYTRKWPFWLNLFFGI